ncbi:hypothetical protein [Streptomyces sp. NPDC001292]
MNAGTDGSVGDYAGTGGNPSGAGDATALAAADKPAAFAAAGKGSSST